MPVPAAATGAGPGAALVVVSGDAAPSSPTSRMSVCRADSSACFVITMMLMRRLIGLRGFFWSNSTTDDKPTTRAILSAFSPPASSARRAELARLLKKER